MEFTLIDAVAKQMQDDDEDRAKQSNLLEHLYDNSTDMQREAIDKALICICGWSLDSLRGKK